MRKLLSAVGTNLLLVLVFCGLSYGANPSYRYFDNTGGLNQKVADIMIADNECSDCQNVYFDEGAVIKRYGYTKTNASAALTTLNNIYDFQLNDGTRKVIGTTTDGNIYKMDSIDGVFDDITPLTGGITASHTTFATFTKTDGTTVTIIANGTNEIHQWNSSAANASVLPDAGGGAVAEFQYVYVFKNRLWGAGEGDFPNRLYYTASGEADDWANGSTIEIDNNDGDKITGLCSLSYAGTDMYDKLVIFKERSIYVLDADDATPSNWVLSKLRGTIGCISHWSIQRVLNGIIFLSYDGVYALENEKLKKLSEKIDPIFRGLNPVRLDDSCSALNRSYNQYWLAVSDESDTANGLILVYDYMKDCWTKFSGITAEALAEVIEPTTHQYRLYSADNAGFMYRQWIGTNDNGTAISAYYTTKNFTFGAIDWLKRVMYLYVYAYASGDWDLSVKYSRDGNNTYATKTVNLSSTGSLWGTFVWGTDTWGGSNFTRKRKDLDTVLWGIKLKLENNNLDETFKVYGWSFNVQPLERDDY